MPFLFKKALTEYQFSSNLDLYVGIVALRILSVVLYNTKNCHKLSYQPLIVGE